MGFTVAVTESGTGMWDLGCEDSGTLGCGSRGCQDVGRRMWGCGNMGCKNVPINKQHLKFMLNLQFTIFGGQERERYYVMESTCS